MKTLTIIPSLAQKFQEAAAQKVDIQGFIKEFLGEFISPETKTAYVKDLAQFFEFLRSGNVIISHPSEIQSFHFQLYRDHLVAKKLASATINRYLVSVRSFVKWAVAAKLMTHNPLDTIKLPKVQTEAQTVAFEDAEVVQMIQAADVSNHKGRTHRLAMILLFNLGLRRSELIHIKLSDISQERGHTVLSIAGKGDKVRLIPLNDFVHGEILAYLGQLQLNSNDFLLQTEGNVKNVSPIDGSTIYRMIAKYSKQLGINKAVSPHSCRATVISHLLDTQNASIREVATFAGHSNITTTERYDKRRNSLDKSVAYQVEYK